MPDKNKIILGTNDDTYIAADDAGNIVLQHEQGQRVALTDSAIEPATDETLDLGSATNKFKDLYLSSDSIYIGNTKLSSDPTTGALSTVVADEQGQYTAPASPVGGSSSTFDWKGTSVNESVTTTSQPSALSMGHIVQDLINGNTNTQLIYIFPFDFPGNPTSSTVDFGGKSISAGAPFHPNTVFFQDENGDNFSQWISNKMDEENRDFYHFDIEFIFSVKTTDSARADLYSFLTGSPGTPGNGHTSTDFGNAQTVTKRTLMSFDYMSMYAAKAPKETIQNLSPALGELGTYANGVVFKVNGYNWSSSNTLPEGSGSNPIIATMPSGGNPSLIGIYNHIYEVSDGSMHLDLNFSYNNEITPNVPNLDFGNPLPSFPDVQEGIEIDMLVKLRA